VAASVSHVGGRADRIEARARSSASAAWRRRSSSVGSRSTRTSATSGSGRRSMYLLIGLRFVQVSRLIAQRVPGAFLVRGTPADYDAVVPLLRYYSFVTLTSLGFGDITPVHPVARSMTVLEALIGVLYPAVLIARLISLEGTDPHPSEHF